MKIVRHIFLITVVMKLSAASIAFAGSLQDAIIAGNFELVQSEIAQGADVNAADMLLVSPLMIAAE